MKKLNCWEILHCGLQAGGSKAKTGGVCPASTVVVADGINGGTFAGRACWAIPNTLCGNPLHRAMPNKQETCRSCKVYNAVKTEEGANFLPRDAILEELMSYTCY